MTNRQRCLIHHLLSGWHLVEGVGRYHLAKDRPARPPSGFEWVDTKTITALATRGVIREISPGRYYLTSKGMLT
jgi:hypothetical protein